MKIKLSTLLMSLFALFFIMTAFSLPTVQHEKPVQEKIIRLDLTVSETEYVLTALQEKPMKEVSGLVTKIFSQAQRQLADTTKKK